MSYFKNTLTPDMLRYVRKHYFDEVGNILPGVSVLYSGKDWLILQRKDDKFKYTLDLSLFGQLSFLSLESLE